MRNLGNEEVIEIKKQRLWGVELLDAVYKGEIHVGALQVKEKSFALLHLKGQW